MNQTSPSQNLKPPQSAERHGPGDNLDRLLTDYFHSKLRHPWPAAPTAFGRSLANDPSELVASKRADLTDRSPRRDGSRAQTKAPSPALNPAIRSRYTLALSTVLLVGACWLFSNGYQPSPSLQSPTNAANQPLGVFREATADNPVLKENRKTQAENAAPIAPMQNVQLP